MSKKQLRQQRKAPKERFCEWRGLNATFLKNMSMYQKENPDNLRSDKNISFTMTIQKDYEEVDTVDISIPAICSEGD